MPRSPRELRRQAGNRRQRSQTPQRANLPPRASQARVRRAGVRRAKASLAPKPNRLPGKKTNPGTIPGKLEEAVASWPPGTPPTQLMSHPFGVTAVATIFLLAAAYLFALGVLMLLAPETVSMSLGAPLLSGLELAGPYMFLLMAALGTTIGLGLLRLNRW